MVWLPYFVRYWTKCVIVCVIIATGRDVKNFEINLNFLIKPFFCLTKRSRQKFKYLEDEKSFKMK